MRVIRPLSLLVMVGLGCAQDQAPEPVVTPQNLCVDDAAFFAQNVWPQVLQNKCLGCHNAQGIARATEFVMMPSAQPGYMEANQAVLSYLASLERDGTSFILLKPTEAIPHGGGQVLTPGSEAYATLEAFAARVKEPVVCETETVADEDAFAGVTICLLYTSPSPRDRTRSRMPSSA